MKKLCKLIEKTGDLRKECHSINFNKIYTDPQVATQKRFEFYDKLKVLSDIQFDLLEMMKEVRS